MSQPLSFKQKLVLIIFGLFLTLIIIEIGLRIGGYIILSLREQKNKVSSCKDNNEYRIMCLGESTTAGGGNNSWPRQLDKILKGQKIGVDFKVINKGRERINSNVILAELSKNLDNYNPDIVIAMMGVNDSFDTKPYEESLAVKTDSFTKGLRVYMVEKLLLMHIKNKFREIQSDNSKGENGLSLSEKPMQLNELRDRDRENELRKNIEISNKYVESGVVYLSQRRYEKAEEVFKKAIELDSKNIRAYVQLSIYYRCQKKFKEIISLSGKIREQGIKNDILYSIMADSYLEQGKTEEAEEYFRKANELRLQYFYPATRHNYKKLKEIVTQRGIKLVCIQYPMRSIKPLKKIFDSIEGLILVDNEQIFKNAVKQTKYEDYFTDNFGGDFGHCTRKGNSLLAENVATAILKEIFNK